MINKEKNINFSITMDKVLYNALVNVEKAFRDHGIPITKSIILSQALSSYINKLADAGRKCEEKLKQQEVVEPQKGDEHA